MALLLGTLFLPTALQAANGTWTNTGSTSANWSDTSNWSGGTVPGATSGTTSADVATFSSALGTYGTLGSPIVIDAGRNLGGMVFTNSAGAYTVGTTSGEVLLLSAGGMIRRQALSTASNAITINAPLRLYGNYTIYNDNNDSGGFRIGGAISGTAGAAAFQTLTLSGWGAASTNNVLSGPITGGTNGGGLNLDLYDPSTWTLTGTSTITGRIRVSSGTTNAGTLRNTGNLTAGGTAYDTTFRLLVGVFDNQSQLALTGPLVLDNNASLFRNSGTITQSGGNRIIYLNEGSSFANSGTINLQGIQTGDWGVDGGAAATASFTNSSGGNITVNELWVGKNKYATFINSGGNVTVSTVLGIGKADNGRTAAAGTNTFNLNSGTVTVNSGATFRLGAYNTASDATGIFNLNGGTLATAVGVTGPSGSNNTGTFNFNGGTLQATANNITLLGTGLTAVNIRTNGATVDVGSGLTATISANLLDGGGNGGLTKTSAGTLILSGANTYAGGTTNSAGTLSVGSSSALGTGTLTMNGGTLGVTGGGGWTLTNAVTLSANSTADTGGGNLTLGGTISGTGSLNKGWNNNTLTIAGTYAATGDLLVAQGTLNFTGTQTGGGNIEAQYSTVFNNTGSLSITNAYTQLKLGGWGSSGTMAVFNNNTNGVVNHSSSGSFCIGKGGPGTFNNNGGTVTVANTALLSIGLEGNRSDLTSGSGILNVNAGTFTVTSAVPFIYLGGTGSNTTNSTGVINLNGGTFATATRISKWQGTNSGTGNSATVNFNGGTLRGTANNLTLLGTDLTAVNIRTNGATVDVGAGLTNTISANLLDGGGNGGLTKTGAGTLVLSGANTYTGATTVSGGTLTVNNNGSDTFSDTTTIQISSGAVLNLPNDVTDIVGTLVLGGQTYTSGVFDSSNSGGLIAGSGKIQVGATVVAGYSTWASQNAPTGTATDDYDNDGVANGLEYVLGGSKDTQDANKKPQCSVSGGVMTFTFVRDQASINGTTQVAIEVGINLGTWPSVYSVGTDTAGSSAGVSVTKNSPATGKDTVSLSVSGSDSKKFARLRVITN